MTATVSDQWGPLAQPVHEQLPVDPTMLGGAPWRDNAYLAFWDRERAVFGVVHVSTSPNAAGRRARCSLTAPGLSVEVIEDLEPGTFASEHISFDLEAAKISVHTPELSGELTMTPRFQLADYSPTGLIPDLVKDVGLRHYQQGVEVRGLMTARGTSYHIDGQGLRDRTWGPRDESAAWPEYVAVAACTPDYNVTAMKFRGNDGSTTAHGFMLHPDRTEPISRVDLTRDAAGLITGAGLTTSGGRELRLRMRTARAGLWVPMGAGGPPPTMSAYDDSVDVWVEDEDEPSGAGLTEQGVIRYL